MTLPLPLPLAPDGNVSHATGLDAVHAQPAGDVTVTVPLPPGALKENATGRLPTSSSTPSFRR